METKLRYHVKLSIYKNDKVFGPGIAELLRLVDEKGSLRQAAGEMDMAYSKAWRIVKDAGLEYGHPLLLSQPGGKHGGGAQLTAEGRALLERYTAMDEALQRQAQQLFEQHFQQL